MHLVGIVGGPRPVGNSLSPCIQNAAFAALGLDWLYAAFPVSDDPVSAIRGLVDHGVRGLNVTMPYKVAAADSVDDLDSSAAIPGCVNTIQVLDGRAIGYNTDGDGLVLFLERDVGFVLPGSKVAILGAGGAARSALISLANAGCEQITVAARDLYKAQQIAGLVSVGSVRP
ncbi:MAG: shikimate dehydrogenase, partial [Actinomycetota bacterium]